LLPRLLLDTPVAIRWVSESRKLSRQQTRALEGAMRRTEPVAVCSISLLEMAVLASQGRVRLKLSLDQVFEELRAIPGFQILPLTYEIATEVVTIGNALKDPADQAIVATARVHRLRLVTSDQRIIDSKLVPVVD
jgi:PIN domain nuclease of toxin-antitoxin system